MATGRKLLYPRSCGSFYLILILSSLKFIQLALADYEDFSIVIGIDLGMKRSCVGAMKNGKVEIIANNRGHYTTPTCVAFTDEEQLVGIDAEDQANVNPGRTVFDVKRIIGREFLDKEVQNYKDRFPLDILDNNSKPNVKIDVNGSPRIFSPEKLSAMILREMKETAELYLGEEVTSAVITVPAYFNDKQRQATKDAGALAGLNVLRLVNEPTAAAIAYGLDKVNSEQWIVVYNLGGGTFDVSVISVEYGVFEILSTVSDEYLGGENFTQRVVDYYVKEYNMKYNIDITKDPIMTGRLMQEAEKAKCMLSSTMSTSIKIDAFYDGSSFSETLTRSKFEDLNSDLFKRTLSLLDQALKDARVVKEDINDIVLAGGSTRIPMLQTLIEEYFGGKKVLKGMNPDEIVAFGAAVQGGILGSQEGIFCGPIEVNTLGIGIMTSSGILTKLIPRHTIFPTRKSQVFSTGVDNQEAILIKVFEGERVMAKDNKEIGQFVLKGIPPAPRGVPQIEVQLELDANDILKVTATDRSSGRSESLTITKDKRSFTEEEIIAMLEESEKYYNEDETAKKRIESLNGLENYPFKLVDEVGISYKNGRSANIKEYAKETTKAFEKQEDRLQGMGASSTSKSSSTVVVACDNADKFNLHDEL